MTIDTPVPVGSVTISGSDYPIFGTHDRAVEYLNGSLSGSEFTGATEDQQNRSLVTSKRWLDRQRWKPGFPVPDDGLVPLGIEFAEYELAVVLLGDDSAFTQVNQSTNERRLKAGSVEIEFFREVDAFGSGAVFPPQAMDLLRGYLASSVSIISPTVGGLENKYKPYPSNPLTGPL